MDIQNLLDNAVAAGRAEELKHSPIMTLGEAIAVLENINLQYTNYKGEVQDKQISFDFCHLYPAGLISWRGIYAELAITYTVDGGAMLAKDFLKELKEAVGKTYEGYKGGDFTMGKATPLHVDNCGDSSSTALIGIKNDDYEVTLQTWKLDR